MKSRALAVFLTLFSSFALAEPLPPFTAAPVSSAALKPTKAAAQAIDCLSPARASLWIAELPPLGQSTLPFSIANENGKPTLRIDAANLTPAYTTIRILLPGDGPANGDLWAKARCNYLSFLCKSNKPAQMTFHLLQRGKTAGTYQTAFSVEPGDWQRIILPIEQFSALKSFAKVAGLGVRTASAEKGTEVAIADVTVGSMPFSDDLWKARHASISLKGDWHFAADPTNIGAKENWFADTLDDTSWKTIKSGLSWQEQGIETHGFGWYRQKIVVPQECAGLPLTLNLCDIQSDDDVWFNGTRIGGFSSEYKYSNWIPRIYTIPASLIRYGQPNTIALRIWGGNITFIGDKSGLAKGPLVADFDPYPVRMRDSGAQAAQEIPAELYDLSDARNGKPFEIVIPFPSDLSSEGGANVRYRLADGVGGAIKSGQAPLTANQIVIPVDRDTAHAVYLRGRLHIALIVEDGTGNPIYSGTRLLDRLNFLKRDQTALPALADKIDDTPFGQLKLIDEIDAATPVIDDPHPYLQSSLFDKGQDRMTPGSNVPTTVTEILGQKARQSAYGWFAYRVGRGKLTPHATYLLRIEYPEDKPRFCPIEIQTGQNYMDVGWKNGVGPDDVYDNWPLSHKWQWYDVVVPLDDETVGTGGTGTASSENGVWVYFMNKLKPNQYYAMWSGGPAVGRIRLYQLDPVKNAPAINQPKGLPNRVLSFDWERGVDHDPADFVRYAKLMGYNAISPIMLKWFFANYTDPLNGYTTVTIDDHNYWAHKEYDPASGVKASSPVPANKSEHVRYLEATKQLGLNYIPRFEYGGSQDLPKEAWALGVDQQPTKANRFAPWCADLLNPMTWDDLQKFMDHLIKPYTQDNPQLTGVLWRIRCDRMPISYGPADIQLFAKETGATLPRGGDAQWAAWAAGEMRTKYDDWWHQKRADFHTKLAKLLQSYRPDLKLYYYNWDEDKFSLIEPDITSWAFVSGVVKPLPEGGRAAYEKERAKRKTFTAADYIDVLHTGNFGNASKGINRADYGIRPELYKDVTNMQIFAPANYLCYADKPEYLNYFRTGDGVAVSNVVSYDEVGSRTINPKYEGNMITPAGGAFSMALELLGYFHADARTLNYTVYTYGRGFADAHRRFAQAFLALPAIDGTVVDQGDGDLKVRTYASANGTYLGVAFKGYAAKKLTITVPNVKPGATLRNLVTNQAVPATVANGQLQFTLDAGPMELDAFLIQ